jgi:hypothetical protein
MLLLLLLLLLLQLVLELSDRRLAGPFFAAECDEVLLHCRELLVQLEVIGLEISNRHRCSLC